MFSVKKPERVYHDPRPARPEPGIMGRLFGTSAKIEQEYLERCARVDAENAEVDQNHEAALTDWETRRSKHDNDQA